MARCRAPADMRLGRDVVEQGAAGLFERMHGVAALRAERQMRGDHDAAGLVERAGRESRQRGVAWMMDDAHCRSPNRLRKRAMARRTRDLTVPSGRLSSAAISPWARPSKNESCTTRTCSCDSSLSAARTRCVAFRGVERAVGMFRPLGLDHLVGRVKFCPVVAAQPVDAQIAGDGKNPGRGAGARRIEIGGLAPHREQRLLRQIFGRIGRRAEPHQHRLDPRRIELEQRRERGAVLRSRQSP